MATKTERQTKRLPRVTTPEAVAGPLFAILVVMMAGGQRGVALGLAVFIAGIALALLAGWAVSAATSGDHADQLRAALRALGTPGSLEDWRDIGTTAGVASVAGMLLGSLAGGVLAQRQSAPVVAR